MAKVSFFLRGKVNIKESTIWTRFRHKNIDISQPIPYLKVKPNQWKDGKCKSPLLKMFETDEETINAIISDLERKIITDFQSTTAQTDMKAWLKSAISPIEEAKPLEYSDDLLKFIDIYIDIKKGNVGQATVKKADAVKQLLTRYVAHKRKKSPHFTLLFKDLNNYFRTDFEKYSAEETYQISYTYRNLGFIKMICNVAKSFDIEVNKHVFAWKFELEKASKNKPKSVYLTLDELEIIDKHEQPHEHLENAKDWLIIACFTAQRVSDFMNFTSNLITTDTDGTKYIEFTQVKTGARMKIPLLQKVQEILDKRNGEFPRKISDVKFNLYIKEVCKIAGLDEMIFNGKTTTVTTEGIRRTRKSFGEFPKYELVTSHIGRKSFATNFYEKVPTSILLNFTGHTTERQLLSYINKTPTEKAKSTAAIFSHLGY